MRGSSTLARRLRCRLWYFAGVVVSLMFAVSLLIFAAPAFAQEGSSPSPAPEPVAPNLEMHWNWWTAILSFGLVAAFYIMMFVLSEREFKGVVAERFGPKK